MAEIILVHNSRTKIWDWWWIINNISFHFRLFPRKTNDKIFQQIPKILFWIHFGPFLPKFGRKWIFLEKKSSVSFQIFQLSTIVPKRQKKLMSHFWEKRRNDRRTDRQADRETERQTDNSDFIGPPVRRGSNKLYINQTALLINCLNNDPTNRFLMTTGS